MEVTERRRLGALQFRAGPGGLPVDLSPSLVLSLPRPRRLRRHHHPLPAIPSSCRQHRQPRARASVAMALDPIAVEFAFADGFLPGVGPVGEKNYSVLHYSGWIALYVNDLSQRHRALERGYNRSIAREVVVMEGTLRHMRGEVLQMVQDVRNMGGVPVLLPQVLEDALDHILGPVDLPPGAAAAGVAPAAAGDGVPAPGPAAPVAGDGVPAPGPAAPAAAGYGVPAPDPGAPAAAGDAVPGVRCVPAIIPGALGAPVF